MSEYDFVEASVGLLIFIEYFGIVPAAWRILRRAGFSPIGVLWLYVPGLGTWVLLAWLAFAKWPSEARRA